MPEHNPDQLSAYLDGELHGRSLLAMQAHLQTCQECQDELAALRRLSHLLQAAPLPVFTPPHRFSSQLMLKLPRRDAAKTPRKTTEWAGWLVPVTLLAIWIFIQATVNLAALVSISVQAGFFGDTLLWASGSQAPAMWFTAVQLVMSGSLNTEALANLQFIHDISLYLQSLLVPIIWQIVLALFYWLWLAIWWQRRQKYLLVENAVIS